MTENQKLREALLSDMDIAVLRMPVNMAFAGNMAQFQYHNRVQSLLNRIDALALPTEPSQTLYECTGCNHLYQHAPSSCDCCNNPENMYNTWTATKD